MCLQDIVGAEPLPLTAALVVEREEGGGGRVTGSVTVLGTRALSSLVSDTPVSVSVD